MDRFVQAIKQAEARYGSILDQLKRHQIPEFYPEADRYPFLWGEQSLDEGSLLVRDEIIRLCGYCLLSYTWIRPLAEWIGNRRCLELMCGSGALAYALQTCGVQVIATDNFSWRENRGCWYERPWMGIEQMDCLDAIQKYGPDADLFICSWPYMDDSCYHALLKMREVNPAAFMLYIGEGPGGGTASASFFEVAEPVEDEGFQLAVQLFRSAYTIKDRPMLFR